MGPTQAVAAVRLAVRSAIADLPPGATVLVACSGGADSLALADALAFEARSGSVRAGGVTVDHGLQVGSAERADHVVELLTGLGLDPVGAVRVDVGSAGGPEGAARSARYAALDAVADEERAAAVLLGHTLDDQAETVLLGLARGAGARSLAGMAPVSARYRRPLLALARTTTQQACRDVGLEPWDDPHNRDPAFARVRVRHEVLPGLERALGPGISAALARTAQLLRADADALESWADEVGPTCRDDRGDLVVARLVALPVAIRTRILRRAATSAGSRPGELTLAHVESVDALVTAWRGQGPLHLPGGVRAARIGPVVQISGRDGEPSGLTP